VDERDEWDVEDMGDGVAVILITGGGDFLLFKDLEL